jgi:hypothetical protein
MGPRFGGTALGAVAMMVGLGCAQGMPGPDEFSSSLRVANPIVPAAAAGTSGPAPMAPPPPPATFMGTPCMMGQAVPCTCTDGVSMGTQMCRFDMLSPTKGVLGPCDECVAPMAPPAAGMAGGDVGSAGASGNNGSANGGMGGASAGSGGMGGAGMSGSGGSGGAMMMCDPDDCPGTTGLFGIEREPCCTRRGECGGINALSGSCEEG